MLYGLDRPLYVQYWDWLTRIVQLDFGNSMSADSRPVLTKILERLPLTVGMNVTAMFLTLLIAIPVGIVSACRQNSLLDKSVTVLVFLGFAMPSFWLALLLAFALTAAWFVQHDDADQEEPQPEWREGPNGFGLYDKSDWRIDPHVTDDD